MRAPAGCVAGGRLHAVEALTRSSGGYVAIYAVGSSAVLVLLGDEGLDVARLHRESRAADDDIEALLA